MMALIAALSLALPLGPGAQEPAPASREVAIVVVTTDDVRQGQIKHGRSLLASLGDERFGRYRWLEPAVAPETFRSCEDDSPGSRLESCVRFYMREGGAQGAMPTVVVAFTDWSGPSPLARGRGAMRVLCYGRGAAAAEPAAQDAWLWPDSARLHGVNDWNRDRDALAACIDAALAEAPA